MSLPAEISVEEVAGLFKDGTPFRLLDVREPDELISAKIAGSLHISMAEIPLEVLTKLPDKSERIIVHCHHGMRSQRIAEYLTHLGYENVQNMTGGIEAWAEKIDPAVGRY